MNNQQSDSYSPRIQEIRTTFENTLKEGGTLVFMEEDDLLELVDYYGLELQDEQMAEQALEYTLKLFPDSLDAHITKAQALLTKGDIEGAKTIYNNLLDKQDTEALFLKADIFMAEEQIDKAQQTFREITRQLGGFSPECGMDFAMECQDFGYMQEAVEWLEKVLSYNPEDKEALKQMTLALMGCGESRVTEAIEYANRCLDIDPFSVEMWEILARLYFINSDTENCMMAADYCLTLNKKSHIGMLFKVMADSSAIAMVKQKATLHYLYENYQPDDREIVDRYAIGSCLFLCQLVEGEVAEARSTYERNCQYYKEDELEGIAPESFKHELDAELGLLLMKENRILEALILNNKLLKDETVSQEIKINIANSYIEAGLFPWAMDVFRQCKTSDPGKIYCFMAYCCQQMHDIRHWLLFLDKGCKLAPQKAKELFGSHFPSFVDPTLYPDYFMLHWQEFTEEDFGNEPGFNALKDDFDPID